MESLRIYNTLARDKQPFVPLQPGIVRMYVCGMTVYDYCHVGHARVMVVFDIVQRWLRALGYRVTYVRNITDIDDKIIRRAVENGEPIRALTGRFIAALHEDAGALGVARPDHEPRATAFIPQMLDMIGRLEANGYAYQGADGDVNYAVRRFARYGQLSGKSIGDLRAGERVAANDAKDDPLDFVLWKQARASEPADTGWASKYGRGRPGWHIECSAMSCALLGEHFDIHGGGQDLQFPHHENEIAQSEGATGQPFVNYWMHNGYVQIDNEKMSKSLGNFFTIRDVLARYDAEVVRFFIARAHYRSPLNYSDAHLDDARNALTRLYTALKDLKDTNPDAGAAAQTRAAGPAEGAAGAPESESAPGYATETATKSATESATESAIESATGSTTKNAAGSATENAPGPDWNEAHARRFRAAMNDDFNTPAALAVLFEMAGEVNRTRDVALAKQLQRLARVIGLLVREPRAFLQQAAGAQAAAAPDAARIEVRIAARAAAKQAKHYAEADRIRAELLEAGIALEDKPGGLTEWRRV